jgi:unsaturated rhamnogalacturonyl hydrolase
MTAADSFIKQYINKFQNDEKAHTKWKYEDGCVLSGCEQLYKVTGEDEYKKTIIDYMNFYINNDGTINTYDLKNYNIDNINSGKLLFFLYDETGDEKYRKAIDTLMMQLKSHPRTKSNNFWHKNIYPNQIWLDGLYMAQPFYMAYETRYNKKENYNDIINQFKNVRKYIFNEDKQLYYHAYDEAKIQNWANKETGQSPNYWIRAMGWYLMALIDAMDVMSKEIFEHYKALEGLFKEAIRGILKYQDHESKLFYQLIDKPDLEGNYLETSGSSMIAYAILKGCRLGVLQNEKYLLKGLEILEGITTNKLIKDGDTYKLSGICEVAGLGPGDKRDGSVEYYLSENVVNDDLKGVGAFMMAYAQYLMLKS